MALDLNPAIPPRTADLHSRFAASAPFRHVVIDEFLNPEFCHQLMQEFPAFDSACALNERGEKGRKAVISEPARIGAAYARFDRMIRDREFLDLISGITGIPQLLYDPEYVGGGTHENLDGQDLDPHVDFNFHPSRHWHRRLNLIVFLNPEWEPDWGGCLEFLSDPWTPEGARPVEAVIPLANRAVIFETNEHSWHGFQRIRLPTEKHPISRRSIAIYLYTEQRPEAEQAASHGTVYVQRQLPDHIQPGYTLTEDDVEEIRGLLARRDTQIKFLYERELDFSALISGMLRSPSFRIGRAITWPARFLRRVVSLRRILR
ncbi:MAG TPA: 2OG-Fe(II) oxygenase [Bryobacteraceae bacterium]|nr:2OG-Fe(II) oxygenase [Bryobacteraceae bacterium]